MISCFINNNLFALPNVNQTSIIDPRVLAVALFIYGYNSEILI